MVAQRVKRRNALGLVVAKQTHKVAVGKVLNSLALAVLDWARHCRAVVLSHRAAAANRLLAVLAVEAVDDAHEIAQGGWDGSGMVSRRTTAADGAQCTWQAKVACRVTSLAAKVSAAGKGDHPASLPLAKPVLANRASQLILESLELIGG